MTKKGVIIELDQYKELRGGYNDMKNCPTHNWLKFKFSMTLLHDYFMCAITRCTTIFASSFPPSNKLSVTGKPINYFVVKKEIAAQNFDEFMTQSNCWVVNLWIVRILSKWEHIVYIRRSRNVFIRFDQYYDLYYLSMISHYCLLFTCYTLYNSRD